MQEVCAGLLREEVPVVLILGLVCPSRDAPARHREVGFGASCSGLHSVAALFISLRSVSADG